ncbi:hypothetical protein VTN49DRAFT_6483 [Thermomyces lanuginosus]|uniref:uncharacterized protein n=1 Tax=Thermomyces lanuginosus TaxID=5541 RepID=UPI003741FA08
MARTERSKATSKQPTDRGVKHVVLGNLRFQTWYPSIYPEELVSKDTDELYVCQWCFRYTCEARDYSTHVRGCGFKSAPPGGTKVYEHGGYVVWEVDGESQKLYAQNLSLFSKLFLDHKSVFFDVTSFLYYILTFTDPQAPGDLHVLGYFSKEKLSWDANNLACILIFPPYQHKQLGKLLMGVSYKLSGWECQGGVIGGPEKPLSDMGRRSYTRFWEERVARYLLHGQRPGTSVEPTDPKAAKKHRPEEQQMTVRDIGLATGMLAEDVITALKSMGVVEPNTAATNRKRKRASVSGSDMAEALDGDDTVIVRKSNVLEWIKIHNVSLRDPVRGDRFVGEWSPENLRLRSQRSEGEV